MQKYKEEYLYLCQIILIARGYIKMAPFWDTFQDHHSYLCCIVGHLPESSQPFVLQEYKKTWGMLYSLICLYLMEYDTSGDDDVLIPK